MKYNVTDIEFYLDEVGDGIPEFQLTFDEEIAIRDSALGIWEAKNEDDLRESIIDSIGYYPVKIDFEIQVK
tara:strand:- start:1707 stop:1919 length:213 start_codon:yes stop_codon:yes gene_type:complete